MIAGLASIIPVKRSAEDIFAGRIRVVLGDPNPVEYVLPVRSRRANREWLGEVNRASSTALDRLPKLDDEEEALLLLSNQADAFADLLASYDVRGILPARDALDDATDLQILRAIVEVWLAANPPLVAVALGLAPRAAETPSPLPSLTALESTDGLLASSRTS